MYFHRCFSKDLEAKLLDVIYQYEQAAASFTSLLKEPRLDAYVNDRGTGLELECDKEDLLLNKAREKPWPSIELLFGNDEDYQRCIADLVQYITVEINNVESYAQVQFSYIFWFYLLLCAKTLVSVGGLH